MLTRYLQAKGSFLSFTDVVFVEDGILAVRLFSFINFFLIIVAISFLLIISVITRRETTGPPIASLPIVAFIISIPIVYGMAVWKRRRFSSLAPSELSKLRSNTLIKWSEIKKIAVISGRFSIWTTNNQRYDFQPRRADVNSVEKILREKTKVTWIPMHRRWKALIASFLFAILGILCATLPQEYWAFRMSNGTNVILYPFLIMGYSSLLVALVLAGYFLARPKVENPV